MRPGETRYGARPRGHYASDTPPTLPAGRIEGLESLPLIIELARFALSGGLMLASAVAVDLGCASGALSWRALAGGLGLGMLCGVGAGTILGTLSLGVNRVGTKLTFAVASGAGLAVAGYLIDALSVVQKLSTHRFALAAGAGIGSVCAGVGVALALCALFLASPLERWLTARSSGLRVAAYLVPSCVVVLIVYGDTRLFVGTYVAAHNVMRIVAFLLLFAIVVVSWRGRSTGSRALGMTLCLAMMAGFLGAGALRGASDFQLVSTRPYAGLVLAMARAALDLDGDGYAAALNGQDCRPFDRAIHPFAEDIPDDGIDQDCFAGDRHAETARHEDSTPKLNAPAADAPSVVLISVDTLAADRMSLYGCPRRTTPILDAWAKRTVRFTRAYTPGPTTAKALAALSQGLYPRHIKWSPCTLTSAGRLTFGHSPQLDPGERAVEHWSMPVDHSRTIAALLGQRGYVTAAVLDVGAEDGAYLHWTLNAQHTFSSFQTSFTAPAQWRDDSETTKRALTTLASMPTDKPFFLWVHYFGPHTPDTQHADAPTFTSGVMSGYDNEIAYVDQALAPLLTAIDELSNRTSLVTVFTADHGEEAQGLSRNHGPTVHESAIHVPLLIAARALAPHTDDRLVSLIDVLPTLLSLTDSDATDLHVDGVDLFAPEASKRLLYTESANAEGAKRYLPRVVAVMDDAWKLALDTLTLDELLSSQSAPDQPQAGTVDVEGLRSRLWTYASEPLRVP